MLYGLGRPGAGLIWMIDAVLPCYSLPAAFTMGKTYLV